MMTQDDYKLMKELVDKYEKGKMSISNSSPYIIEYSVETIRKYNSSFGDDKICQCGHSYYRHFDSYEEMEACGCKYCSCYDFKLAKSEIRDNKLKEIGI